MSGTLTVLGSCGAWPEPGRACSGFLLEHDGTRVVLDLGYGTVSRLLDHLGSASADGLDAVVVTHRHPDHVVDLHALLRARWFGARGAPPLPVHAAAGVRELLVALEDGDPEAVDTALAWHPLPAAYDVGPLRLTSVAVPHFVPSVAVRLEAEGLSLAYSGDTGPSEDLVGLCRGVDLLVCEATDRHQRPGRPPADRPDLDLDARGAGEVATAAGARRLLLTHLWPGNDREQALADARSTYAGPVEVATEGLVLAL